MAIIEKVKTHRYIISLTHTKKIKLNSLISIIDSFEYIDISDINPSDILSHILISDISDLTIKNLIKYKVSMLIKFLIVNCDTFKKKSKYLPLKKIVNSLDNSLPFLDTFIYLYNNLEQVEMINNSYISQNYSYIYYYDKYYLD